VTDREELSELREALKLGDYGEFYLTRDIELAGTPLEKHDQLLAEAAFPGKTSRRDVDKLDTPALLRFRFTGCLTKGHKKAWRQLEHNGAVRCLDISAEGAEEFLYSGSRDRTVKKWALADGSCVHTYEGHSSMVRCLSVNAKYLVSGADDRKLKVWSKTDPQALHTLSGHDDFVRSVALCKNLLERAVSAGDDRRVILWDIARGARLLEYAHSTIVGSALLNASLMVTAGEDGILRVWRTESAELKFQKKHPGPVTAVSWR